MSVSVFFAVRFSPAPKLGEWLNIAVIGESVAEKKAAVRFGASLDRVQQAFGSDAVKRVQELQKDLSRLAQRLESAHLEGEPTQPIPSVQADKGLSLSFSEEIVVFEGSFEESLDLVTADFLGTPVQSVVQSNGDNKARQVLAVGKRPGS